MDKPILNDGKTAAFAGKSIWLAVFFAWVCPGAGHLYLGRRKKGLALFAVVAILLFAGLFLSDFRDYLFSENPFYYLGRVGSGLVLVALSFLTRMIPAHPSMINYFETGSMYVAVSGLLNLLIISNTIDIFLNGSSSGNASAVKKELSEKDNTA